jgi:hypothetical protein
MPDKLKTDQQGNIISFPVIGWTTATFAGTAVLLAIDYAESAKDMETGGKSVQLALTPHQALELGERLTTLAKHVLTPPSGKAN